MPRRSILSTNDRARYATLVALAVEGMATVTDEIIDLHDRILGKLFNAAKNKHQEQFQASGKAINDKVRLYGRIGQALLEAKKSGGDPFAAIEAVIPWDAFAASVTEAQKLAQPLEFDFLPLIGESYATLRRYAPEFLQVLKLRAVPAAKIVLDGIGVLIREGMAVSGVAGAAASAVRAAREAVRRVSRSWAACLGRIFEVDVIKCARCGGEMRMIAVISEDVELDRLLPSIGVEADFPKTMPARSPPMFRGDEDTQLDPRVEAWDGVDEERVEE